MTQEEREARREARKKENKALNEQIAREAPMAFLTHYRTKRGADGQEEFLTLILPSGYPRELKIRYSGDGWFETDDWGSQTAEISDFFDDLHDLARLIRALTVRYNTMARQINETVRETPPMETLESLPAQEAAS